MNAMHRLRLYHLFLALFATAAYFTAEVGAIHAWLGYGVAAIIVIRLLMAAAGLPQLGLFRFYPHFTGLKLGTLTTHPAISRTLLLGIALSLLGVTGTGIAMDGGRTFSAPVTLDRLFAGEHEERHREAAAGDDEDESDTHEAAEHEALPPAGAAREDGERHGNHALKEVHETLGNLLLVLVGLHVAYLVSFKRPLAFFMAFLPTSRRA